MIDAYDTLMDSLAALAVEAVCTPVTAVQSYWLILVAQQHISGASLTLGDLLRQAQEETVLPMPRWAQPLASQALERLWREGVWWETPGSLALPQMCTGTDGTSQSQAVVRWKTMYQPYIDEIRDYAWRIWQAACCLYGPQIPDLAALPEEVRRGVVLFEAGLYFACHEYFETLWGRTGDAASDFVSGYYSDSRGDAASGKSQCARCRHPVALRDGAFAALPRSVPGSTSGSMAGASGDAPARTSKRCPALTAYQFDPRHVPHILNRKCEEVDMRFAGKVALVTGSSRGIGRAIALRLAREGAEVVVHYRRQTVAAQETAAAIAALGRRALVVQAELGEAPAVRRMFAQVHETFGVLDIFVANAAATAFKPLLEQQAHHIDKTFAITVDAFVLAVQEAAKLMQGRHGKIVTVSGIDARRYIPLHGALGCRQGRPRSPHHLSGL